MNTVNSKQTPYFYENDIVYKISTAGWTNMTSGTALSANNPYGCGLLNQSNPLCYPIWSVTPKQVGDYSVRIYAGSPANGTSETRNITVMADTYVTDFTSNQSIVGKGRSVELTARLLDDESQPMEGYNITFWDETFNDTQQKYYIGSDFTDSNGYAYVTYSVPQTAKIGTHTLNASYNGSSVEYLNPDYETTTLDISSVPYITNVSAEPNVTGFGYNVTLNANVTDEVGVNSVIAYVTYPNSTQTSLVMTNNTKDIYKVNFTDTWQTGTYSYYIYANNTDGISNSSETKYFYVNVSAQIEVVTENDTYKALQTVYLSDRPQSWWNYSFSYRIPVQLTNSISLAKTDEPITVFVDFSNPAYNNSVRVVNENGQEIPSQTWNIISLNSTHMDSANVTFLANVSASSTKTYYIYYDGQNVGSPNYQTSLNVTLSGNYIYFNTSKIYGRYSIDQDSGTTADDDGAFQSFRVFNGTAWNEIMGDLSTLHQGIDRFDYAGYGGGGGVNLDWTLYTIENGTLFKKYKLNATDTTTSTNYTIYLTFYDKSKYAEVRHEATADSIQVYDLAGITAQSGDNIWVDDSNQGLPSWTDAKYATQPTKYISYLRNSNTWGVSFINPPPDGNPSDGNSFEIGLGIDSGVTGLRIDGRGTGEQNVNFPYTFYLAGIKSGNSEVNETWNIINNATQASVLSEEEKNIGLKNTGNMNFKGYLWMIVQTNVTGTWENLMPPVVNDLATETVRTVNVSSILNLSKIWEDGGAWYTDRREPGWYRVNASLKDPYGNVLIDYDLNSIEDVYEFKIVESILKLTELEHENQYDHSINEYEVEDKIDWINVTVTALNSTALSTNITLNLLDQSKQQLSWGPNETKECGDIPEGQSCERRWDNATFGYPIPLTASTGTYTFYWNVSMILENGNTSFNDSLTFKIHNIPNTFSSNLSTTRIYKPGWTWYNFTFNNSWNSSLSNVNVTINCPNATEFSCSCALPGQSGPTCNITSVDAYEKRTIPFNVSVTNNTPNGNYNLNVTMNYTNPGGETRQWNEKQNKVLEIREYGILEITTYQFPTNVTRGETIQLKAYINNTNASTAHNVWFNYTLPSGWTNTSGVLKLNNETLCAYCILWNNITVNVGSSSVLGANEVRLDSESQEGQVDWKIQNIDVYSNTTIIDFQPSDSTPNVGETIQLQAKLRYDNGSSIANENVTFWDQTEDKFINSSLTNSMGIATVSYTISGSAPLGTHILNATYYGSSVKYTRPSSNTTTINVGMPPNITNISATPQNVGYGYNVTIQANVTDADGISKVFAKVTYPNGTLTTLEMTNYTKDIYKVNFTDTWQYGTHSYYIWANDTTNGVTQSSTYYFYVKAKGKVYVKTLNDSYDPNQYVNLTEHGDDSWWNFSWKYKIPVNITEKSGKDLTDYQINITLNTQTLIQQGKMQSYCNDTRVIYYNATSNNYTELSYWINNCNTTSTNIWTKVPYIPANGNSTVYVYYGNPSAQSKSNATTTFEFFDNFSSLSQWTIRSGDESYMRLNNTLGNPLPSLQHIPNPGTGNGDTRGRGTDFKIENATIEYDIYLEGTGRTIHQFFFRTDSLSFNSGYAYRLQTSAADGGWFEFSGGSWSQIGTARPAVSGNTWHHVKLSFAGNNLTAWVDGGSADSVLDSTKLTSDYIGSHTHGTSGWLYDLVDNIIVRKYASTEPNVSVGSENYSGSAVSNDGNVSFKGYLLMTVQKYSGTWQTISVRINDTNTSTIRTIENLSALNIGYLWNQNPWYTDLQGEGTYRVYAALTNPKGNVLNSDLGYLNNTYNFTINPSPVQINIINITIYNVTDNLNPHTYTGDLEDFGTNKTFTLYSGETYRVEIKVNNTGSATWYINNSNISHTNLNSIWQLNATEDIWYSNISERSDTSFTGGNWSAGNVKWNSSLGGIVPAGKNATFYYVFNVTSSQTENRLVNFRIEEPTFIKNDYSTYHIVIAESVPPFLYQEIYGITNVNVTRGNSTKVYARWNETIGQAKAEYNSTTPTLINYTISPPFTGNWTNYTISTTSIWLLGNHSVKIYASDEQGNWNGTLSYLNFKVWGMAEVTSGSLNSSTINVSDTVKIECQVKDTTNNTAIPNYVVSFYNSTNLLGTNTTNSTGWAFHTYTDNSPGTETIVCNVTENENYKINQNNYKQMTLTTKEYEAPKYWDVNDNVTGIVHKTDYVELRTRWTDNYQLSKAVLSTNASGWSNVSYKNLTGAQDWANFTYQIPASMQPGYLAWRQYANDTFNNQNVTNVTSETIIEVWGWSKISEAYLSNKFIYTGNSTTMFCRVVDSNSSSAIGNYPVSFYNSTHLLGTNYTNSTGWSWWNFTDNSNGVETIICNITHNSTLMYNASENNQGSDSLTTSSPGEDITPPFLFNEIYGLNKTTDVMRGESVKAYALWNETISNATIEYNSTNLSTDTYIISGPYTNNWTNYTMTTNSSWSLGLHVVKIRAADPYSNWNTSLTYKTFELWGRSGVYWQMPTGQVNRTVMNLTCYVRDIDTNQPINGYTVYFYDAESYLGWSSTNSSGYAVYQWDASNEDVGPEQMTCSISDDSGKYYKANISSDSETLTIMGKLNTTILAPQNGNEFKKGDTIGLNSTTVDEKGQSVTPTATWYNSTNQIASGENTTWQIPLGHSVGDEMIRIQTTKQYYYSDTKNVTIYVWGWSRITWIAPNDGMHKQNEDIDLICRVTDSNSSSGINNYPVNFYRDDNFLFTNYTNSTGYARYRWNTDSFTGQIVLSCNITDNSTLYYNASQNYEDNTTIQIDTTPPMVENETRWHPSVIHYNETINLTVDVIDSNLDKVWVRLGRPKSSYINVSMNNMTLNRYNLTSSKYSYELGVWNATFFANDTANNQNQSATTLAWEVWGWSEANWTSPEGGNYSQGTIIPLTCQVKDSNTTTGIQNYSVNFYVKNSTDTISLGSNLTNSTGYATKNWDTTAYAQGTYYPKCNITHNSTLYYNVTQNFEDNTTLNITGVAGKLIVALNEPLDNTIVPRYRNFTINATVICKDANCGVVQGRARYNSSGTEPNTDISTAPGTTPFYTFDSNPQSCGTLNQDQNCTLIWKVNSTGSLDSYYNIDVLFSNPSNDTTNSLIRIGLVLVLNVSTDTINWGNLDPNINGTSAPANPYQVGLDKNSNDASGLYIMGTNLVGSTSTPIEVSNISWCKECSGYLTSTRLNNTYQLIQSNPPSGVNYNTYFWLDTPPVYYGYYSGLVTIMANTSW